MQILSNYPLRRIKFQTLFSQAFCLEFQEEDRCRIDNFQLIFFIQNIIKFQNIIFFQNYLMPKIFKKIIFLKHAEMHLLKIEYYEYFKRASA